MPSPEDVQRCSLVEWVRGELWNVMVREEWIRTLGQPEDKAELATVGEDWEVMSAAVTEGWSVVSSEEDFEVVNI